MPRSSRSFRSDKENTLALQDPFVRHAKWEIRDYETRLFCSQRLTTPTTAISIEHARRPDRSQKYWTKNDSSEIGLGMQLTVLTPVLKHLYPVDSCIGVAAWSMAAASVADLLHFISCYGLARYVWLRFRARSDRPAMIASSVVWFRAKKIRVEWLDVFFGARSRPAGSVGLRVQLLGTL